LSKLQAGTSGRIDPQLIAIMKKHILSLLAGVVLAGNAPAAFVLLDNFNGLNDGELNGQGDWSGVNGNFEVVNNGGNKYAESRVSG